MAERLGREVVAFVQGLRGEEVFKAPGVAETLDWSRALVALNRDVLDEELVDSTMGALLKYQDDMELIRGERARALLKDVKEELASAPGSA